VTFIFKEKRLMFRTLLLGSACVALLATSTTFAQSDEACGAGSLTFGVPAAFDTTTATASGDFADDSQCAGTFLDWYGGLANPDVWFKFTAPSTGFVSISTCQAGSFDTSITVSTGDCSSLTQVACNGDAADAAGCQQFYSFINLMPVDAGVTYHVRIGGWCGTAGAACDAGAGQVVVNSVNICLPETGTATSIEACGQSANDGCFGGGATEPIAIGATMRGTLYTFQTSDPTTGEPVDNRDLDFYSFSVTAPSTVTVEAKCQQQTAVFIARGDLTVADCGALTVLTTGTGYCPNLATICLNPGTYYAIVADGDFVGNECGNAGNDYSLKVTTAPAVCPTSLSGGFDGTTTNPGTCDAPGPDTRTSGPTTAPTNFVQGCATGCADGAGGNADVMFAASFQGAGSLEEITCIGLGVASVVSGNDPTTGACAYFLSDIEIPGKIVLYRDTNGGAPTNVPGAAGADLELIASYDVAVPGGVYKGVLNLDEPVCVADVDNLVVVFETPNLFQNGANGVPANAGYRLGIGVGLTGSTTSPSNVWGRYTLCTGTAQNVFAPFGAGSYQWPIEINGSGSACTQGPACPGDFNDDGQRNGADLGALLAGWGTPAGDINGDGNTDGADLGGLLAVFNQPCP
jgi:hypothetical protein